MDYFTPITDYITPVPIGSIDFYDKCRKIYHRLILWGISRLVLSPFFVGEISPNNSDEPIVFIDHEPIAGHPGSWPGLVMRIGVLHSWSSTHPQKSHRFYGRNKNIFFFLYSDTWNPKESLKN